MRRYGFVLWVVCCVTFGSVAHAQLKSVFIEDLTWEEVRDAMRAGMTTAIYYAGSTEQNGPHLALGKHNFVARYVAQRIAETLGNALVYPIMPFAPTGDPLTRTGHMQFPGSVSISAQLFGSVVREVARSALVAGFKHVALMGDHGDGQTALKKVAAELDAAWMAKGARVFYIGDVYFKARDQVNAHLRQQQLPVGKHAGVADTSEILFIDREHKWFRPDKVAAGDASSGVDGDPRPASGQLGQMVVETKIANAVAQIRALISQPPPPPAPRRSR
jgi:creatinine amidohydrolase/Fe(II)-dependent formamide hydrolase-like protein